MWHRIALGIGDTIENLKERMSYSEFVDWCIYYRVEPWGFYLDHLHAGIIASTVHNSVPGRKRGQMKTPDKFMPLFEKAKKQQTKEELLFIMSSIAALQRGKQKHK